MGSGGGKILTMHPTLGTHPSDDELELYSLSRLQEVDTARIEEHLLVCQQCRDRLVEIEDFVRTLRVALRELQAEISPEVRPVGASAERARWGLISGLWGLPKPAWVALAAALLVAVVIWSPWSGPGRVPYEMELRALRAGQAEVPVAPARVPLRLRLDIEGLPQAAGYQVQVVDQLGRVRWEGWVNRGGEMLELAIERGLASGRYWVRIYGTEPGALLREAGFEVR